MGQNYISIKELYPDLFKIIPGWIKGVIHTVTAGLGVGKCMAPETPVMMYDCTIKQLKDVKIGESLMGDDSQPRKVLNKYYGYDNLFEVKQNKAKSYIINSKHILSLNKRIKGKDEVIDIALPDYLNLSNKKRNKLKGFKVGLSFDKKDVFLDPYLLGLWLGDGTSAGAKFSTSDKEILDYINDWAIKNNNKVEKCSGKYDYKVTNKSKGYKKLATILSENNLIKNKHIPDCYLFNSEEIRLKLLAGIIDTDGYVYNSNCEIVQKDKKLAEQIKFLISSLGFRCTIKEKIGKCTNCSKEFNDSNTIYYRIYFFGNFSKIPIRVKRKIQITNTKPYINPLSTGIHINPVGFGKFVGVEVDGNGRFLLDDFTVVHNTKFVKYSFVLHGYNFCKKANIPFYCLYFAHEESVEKFWITIKCDLLQERYGLYLTYYQYKGFHEGMTQEHEEKLKELDPEIEEMKQQIFVYDHVSNPTGMYKTVANFMATIGVKKSGIVEEDDNGNKYQSFSYEYNNPDTQVMVVNDHFGLVTPEKNPFERIDSTHAAMKKWSELCVKYIAKKYQAIVVQIHQQDVSGDGTENLKMGRPEPTLDKLGVNKIVGQDSFVVLGLFRPSRVIPIIPTYLGYDVGLFNGKLTTLHILKHRDGDEGVVKPLFFHGATSKFEELPPAYIEKDGKKIKNPALTSYYK